ncbi:hypothetical protein ANTQUA_LOCUS8728 [Anthophora quadrimaculata]
MVHHDVVGVHEANLCFLVLTTRQLFSRDVDRINENTMLDKQVRDHVVKIPSRDIAAGMEKSNGRVARSGTSYVVHTSTRISSFYYL